MMQFLDSVSRRSSSAQAMGMSIYDFNLVCLHILAKVHSLMDMLIDEDITCSSADTRAVIKVKLNDALEEVLHVMRSII